MTATRLPRTAAILGGGAVGSVLLPALRTIGVRVVAAWTRSPKTPQWRGGPLPRGLREAELILLSVSDASVGAVCAQLVAERLLGPGQIVAHLAGALDLSALEPARKAGAKVGSLHPLRAVPPGSRADALSGAAAGIEGSDDDVRGILLGLAQALHMLPLAGKGARALYRSAAALARGAQGAGLAEAVRAFQSATGAAEPEARAVLEPLASDALEALAADPAPALAPQPLPAPSHAKSIDVHDARAAQIYRQLSQAASELSAKRPRPGDAKVAAISAAPAPAAAPRDPVASSAPKRPQLTLVKSVPDAKAMPALRSVPDAKAAKALQRAPDASAAAPAVKRAPVAKAAKPAPVAKAAKPAPGKKPPKPAARKPAAKAKAAPKGKAAQQKLAPKKPAKKPAAKARPAAKKNKKR